MLTQIVERFPGVSCAYMDAAGTVQTEHYGYSDKEKHIMVDDDTIFPACSMSKFVTAICLMMLHEKKLIDIDAPVDNYLQRWKLLTIDGDESNATIRSLMCHTAGIVDGEGSFYGLRRDDPEIGLMDIMDGKTTYNDRPVREESPHGTVFGYSDAGYCVLQLLIQEVTGKGLEDTAKEMIFDKLHLENTFFASPELLTYYETHQKTVAGYDEDGLPIVGRAPYCPDLAASGLWSTPKELLKIASEFVAAINGRSDILTERSAREMTAPVDRFPWTGLGVFVAGKNLLMTQGWSENGQCMMKMDHKTGAVSVVMTNRDPGTDQSESGVEWLVDRHLI